MADVTHVIGAVAVKVRPSTEGFRRKTKAGVLKELRNFEVEVDVKLNYDMDELQKKLKDLDRQKVKIDIDVDSDVDKAIDDANKALDKFESKNKTRTIKFVPDKDGLRKSIAELETALDQLGTRELKVKMDEDGIRDALGRLRDEFDSAPITIKYHSDVDGYAEALQKIKSLQREKIIQEITFDTDTKSLEAEHDKFQKLLDESPLKLDVNFDDVESLKNARKQMEKHLEGLKVIEIEVDTDKESVQDFYDNIDKMINKAERDEVTLDVNAFLLDVAAQLKYASRTRFVDFMVRVNKRSVAIAEGIMKSLAGWNVITKSGRALESLVTQFDKITVKGGAWMAAIGGIADTLLYLTSATLAVGDDMASVVGLLATLPAALATTAAIVAINVAAWKNFGDAVSGDNEALAKLPPNAIKAAKSLRGTWTSIQRPVQRAFWDGMGDEMSVLADLIIPQFRKGLTDSAKHVGEFGAGVARSFQKIALSGDLKKMFVGLDGFFENLADSAEPFIDALNTLGLRGSEYLPQFGQWVEDIAKKFDRFITSADEAGDINRWIEEGTTALQDMGRVLLGTTDFFKGLAGAAEQAGFGGLSTFADTMQRIGRMVNGEPFKSKLSKIFLGASEGATNLNKGVRDLGGSFIDSADNVSALLRLLGDLGGETLSGLAQSFNNITFQTGLLDAVEGLRDGVRDMGPTFDSLGTIIGTFGTIAGGVFDTLSPLFNTLSTALADVIVELAPEIEDLSDVIAGTLHSVIKGVVPVIQTLTIMLSNALETFNGLPGSIQGVVLVLGGIAPLAISAYKAFKLLSPALATASTAFGTLSQKSPGTATALTRIGKAAGGVAIAATALATFGTATTKLDPTRVQDMVDAVAKLSKGGDFSKLNEVFSQWDRSIFETTDGMQGLDDAIDAVANPPSGQGLNAWADRTFAWTGLAQSDATQAAEKLALLGDELGRLVRNGNTSDAAKAFREVAERFEQSGKTAADAAKLMPGYTDALKGLAEEAGVTVDDTEALNWALSGIPPQSVNAARGLEKTERALGDVGIATDGTIESLDLLIDKMFESGLKTMDARDASFRYQETLKEVKDAADEIATGKLGGALNKNKDDFEKTTEAGRLANDMFQSVARDGIAGLEAAARDGAGQKELQSSLNKTYDDLVKSGEGFGLSTEAAGNLARTVLDIPPGVDIKTWIDEYARQEAERIKKAIDEIPGYKEVTTAVTDKGTTGEVQTKINAITGKEEFIFVTTDGTHVTVQKQIQEVEGVERTVYVTDDGTVISTQENIDALKGKDVTIGADDEATPVVDEAQKSVDGFHGKMVDVVTTYIAKKFPEIKKDYDSLKEKAISATAEFFSKWFPATKGEYDSIESKDEHVWTQFQNFFFPKNKGEYDSVKSKDVNVWTIFANWFYSTKKNEYDSIKSKDVNVWTIFSNWFFGSKKNEYDSMKSKDVDVETEFKNRNYWENKWRWDDIKSKTVDVVTNFISKWFNNGGFAADGAVTGPGASGKFNFKKFADGGVQKENHTAQIAYSSMSSPVRIWAEPETGGEAYIPLAPSKRQRSLGIWEETGRLLGVEAYADGGITNAGDPPGGSGQTFNITNHYPQAEPTSTTVNRAMQLAGSPGMRKD